MFWLPEKRVDFSSDKLVAYATSSMTKSQHKRIAVASMFQNGSYFLKYQMCQKGWFSQRRSHLMISHRFVMILPSLSLLPHSTIMWWGQILANLVNWQPFINVLPTNTFPLPLLYSIDTYFYNFVLERMLELSELLLYLSFKISLITIYQW